MNHLHTTIETPLGPLAATFDAEGRLFELTFVAGHEFACMTTQASPDLEPVALRDADRRALSRTTSRAQSSPRRTRGLAGGGRGARDAVHEFSLVDSTTDEAVANLRQQLAEYFVGTRKRFRIELAPRGTDFQRAVWSALAEIPYGTTTTYATLARNIGRQNSVRAVGAANGANPWLIVVPCHRVVGADGSLTGYSGGLTRKLALVNGERLNVRPVGTT
ncbi:MAG: methylated-DNA--[protein]-cysteine S-methyltransferase [Planctomycetes bacterium]|nr:methylated-DNA--[protein]-cysteine S-methyltransferase [Planctomycetota bacterium]